MKTSTLLVEVRTEELPPPAVRVLAEVFPNELLRRLREGGFTDGYAELLSDSLATPRRFAALMDGVYPHIERQPIKRRGPQVKDCFDSAGAPTPALQGFMRAVGISDVTELAREKEKWREYVVWHGTKPGVSLDSVLPQMVTDAMLAVPDLPSMHWGPKDYAFVRPVRGLVMMLNRRVVDGEVMGVKSSNTTLGHPILSKRPVRVNDADDYVRALREKKVTVDFNKREKELEEKLSEKGMRLRDDADAELMREVAAMCEKPTVYKGEIDDEFLNLPAFCVASCLRKNQKCFPLYKDDAGESIGAFLFVADNEPKDPKNILSGINAVVRARLSDLSFYIKGDKQLTPEKARAKLDGIVYHHRLGSQSARAQRIETVSAALGEMMQLGKIERESLQAAAAFCKLDLPTMAVAEYPEFAGQMAAFYFCEERNDEIAEIVRYHGDGYLDSGASGAAVALYLADKLEKIVGIFLAGEKPVGRRDPHGLRRAALQMATTLAVRKIKLPLAALINTARDSFGGEIDAKDFDTNEVCEFVFRRALPDNYDTAVLNAVAALRPKFVYEIKPRCEALQEFLRRDEAPALIAANKRVNNILRKSDRPNVLTLYPGALKEPAEKALYKCLVNLEKKTQRLLEKDDYQGMLSVLATKAADPVREFFDKVMVNTDDEMLRVNRLALLIDLQSQLNKVADLARLSG